MNKNETTPLKKVQQSSILLSDPKTLHKSDPQNKMKGSPSSLVNGAKENLKNGNAYKKEAVKKLPENK
jgi:hypothetical protein